MEDQVKVLVAAASKHGATRDIAKRIGARLETAGFESDVLSTEQAPAPDGYDAVVLGSGVYAGSWLKSARHYVDRHADSLAAKPVWLFSSGPLGDPLKPEPDEAVKADDIIKQTRAADHELLAGAVSKQDLSLAEKAIMKAVRAPYGDFRDWDSIDAWTDKIAASLAE